MKIKIWQTSKNMVWIFEMLAMYSQIFKPSICQTMSTPKMKRDGYYWAQRKTVKYSWLSIQERIGDIIRVISARRATKHEQKAYNERKPK